jgi:hypothetical protein
MTDKELALQLLVKAMETGFLGKPESGWGKNTDEREDFLLTQADRLGEAYHRLLAKISL